VLLLTLSEICCEVWQRFWESWPAGMGKFIFAWGGICVRDIPVCHSGRAIPVNNTSPCHSLVYRWLPCLFSCGILYWPILISYVLLFFQCKTSHGKALRALLMASVGCTMCIYFCFFDIFCEFFDCYPEVTLHMPHFV